jgi:cytochrome P450
MATLAPPDTTSIGQLLDDLRFERTVRGKLPPGPTSISLRRTRQLTRDPLPVLLECYERYGPVFTVRMFHRTAVFMLGPEANHYVTVEAAGNFSWRRGNFGNLTPLLGDGLLTTDDEYHDRARRIMMPAFHRRRMDAALDVMLDETRRGLAEWRPGQVVDLYEWMRELALRIAMRALLGLDPDDRASGHEATVQFERGLAIFGTDAWVRLLRGPGTPWWHMRSARRALDRIIHAQIERRRREPDPGAADILGMLIEARDEDETGFTDSEVRDQLMTLLFAGHDTSSSTLSFLLYELARHPDALARVLEEQDRVLGGQPPTTEQLIGELPQLDMAVDETLRLYPPAWIGPRRAVEAFEFAGHRVPAGAFVAYCSWASHRLPDVFPDPDAFIPERFSPEARRELPKSAYVPFGGGSRICIGKRFGQLVVKTVATLALQRFRCEPVPGHTLKLHLMPTISPKDALPMAVRERGAPAAAPAPQELVRGRGDRG